MQVITLCGSTKFKKQFREIEKQLTLEGNIVLSVGFFEQSEGITILEEQVKMFEQLHYKKIDMSNGIFVIDVNEYIGSSTRKEINYAISKGKEVRYYSKENSLPSTL